MADSDVAAAPDACYRHADKVAWRDIAGEVLIIQPGRAMMYPLNPTASHIWELLDGARDARAIARSVRERFDVAEDQALRDTLAFVADLEREGLAVRAQAGT